MEMEVEGKSNANVNGSIRKRSDMDVDEGSSSKKQKKPTTVFDEELLRVYYSRLFPYEQMFRWLSYGNDPEKAKENSMLDAEFFAKREFSFTIANDVYIRYLSFRNMEEMRDEMQRKQPHKIDIGAVYTVPPKNHNMVKSSVFQPVSRELVFDIDLDDYAEVRVGCTSDMMWDKGTWQYFAVAMKTLDRALREDFGFEHLLYVFSGRRGIHLWVCDERARLLEDRERQAIVKYLTLISGNDKSNDRVGITTPLHPSIKKAMPMLERVFEDMVLSSKGQDLLAKKENQEKVLEMIPDKELQARLRTAWEKDPNTSSKKKWKQLRATVEDKISKHQQNYGLKKCIDSIIIFFVYPRLDINVSTHRNHLLKSPFAIHPKTGKVCVPIFDIENCHTFDPDGVPTLPTLLKEINDAQCQQDDKYQYKKTSMRQYVEGFDKIFLGPIYKEIRENLRHEVEKHAAVTGDW